MHIKTPITLSIIGCVVNGPEASETEIGITGGKNSNIFIPEWNSNKKIGNDIISQVVSLVEKKEAEILNKNKS